MGRIFDYDNDNDNRFAVVTLIMSVYGLVMAGKGCAQVDEPYLNVA